MHSIALYAGSIYIQHQFTVADSTVRSSSSPPSMCSKVALLHDAVCEARQVSLELSHLLKSAKRTFDALETSSAFASMHGTWKQTLMMVYILSDDLDVAQDFCTYTRTNWKGAKLFWLG